MASTTALRRFAAARHTRSFHSTVRAFIKVGDSIPKLDILVEDSPGNKVNLAEQVAKGKSLIIGVPAAFSMCILLPLDRTFSTIWALDDW